MQTRARPLIVPPITVHEDLRVVAKAAWRFAARDGKMRAACRFLAFERRSDSLTLRVPAREMIRLHVVLQANESALLSPANSSRRCCACAREFAFQEIIIVAAPCEGARGTAHKSVGYNTKCKTVLFSAKLRKLQGWTCDLPDHKTSISTPGVGTIN